MEATEANIRLGTRGRKMVSAMIRLSTATQLGGCGAERAGRIASAVRTSACGANRYDLVRATWIDSLCSELSN